MSFDTDPMMGEPTPLPGNAGFALSDDGQALTIDFAGLEASTEVSGSALNLQEFSTTVPITGDTGPAAIEVAITGYAESSAPEPEPGASVLAKTTARLTIQVNERTRPVAFITNDRGSFVHPVAVRLRGAPECRIQLRLEVFPEPAFTEFPAFLSVTSVNVMFL